MRCMILVVGVSTRTYMEQAPRIQPPRLTANQAIRVEYSRTGPVTRAVDRERFPQVTVISERRNSAVQNTSISRDQS